MASSKCPKCGNSTFEVEQETPNESNFIVTFVRCASCKSAIGVMDFWNLGYLLTKIADKLGVKY